MGLTVKSSYALKALYELAILNEKGIKKVSISELSKKQHIPRDFLEKIFSELRDAGILKSIRGRYGGYALLKSPELLRLNEIVNILDKPFHSYECIDGDCKVDVDCAVEFVWKRIYNNMMLELSKMSLSDIIKYGKKMQEESENKNEE